MAMNTSSGCNAGPFRLAVAMSLACAALPALGADHLSILTFPVGLVVGEHEFEVDLGPSRAPATFMLDGESVCSLGGDIDAFVHPSGSINGHDGLSAI